MKINPFADITATAAAQAAPKVAQGAQPAPAGNVDASSSVGVPVTVSAQTRALDGAQAAGSGVDMDRVEAMRSAIASGEFKVSAEAIADKMLASAQEFLDRVRN